MHNIVDLVGFYPLWALITEAREISWKLSSATRRVSILAAWAARNTRRSYSLANSSSTTLKGGIKGCLFHKYLKYIMQGNSYV